MVLVGCAIFPHGAMVLDPKMKGLPLGAAELHNACMAAAEEISGWNPDLIIMSTPHGLNLVKSLAIYFNSTANGNAEWNEHWTDFQVNIEMDSEIARKFSQHLEADGIEAEGITAFSGLTSPLRWAEVVPLWFLKHQVPNCKYLIISPPSKFGSSSIERSKTAKERMPKMIQIGKSMRDFIESLPQRIVYVASGDLSHVHPTSVEEKIFLPNPLRNMPISEDSSSRYDSSIQKWIETLDPEVFTNDSANLIATALSCGFDGFAILQGTIGDSKTLCNAEFESTVYGREAPTYYGMMVATLKKRT